MSSLTEVDSLESCVSCLVGFIPESSDRGDC
jgi:hypothetical protein